MEEVYLSYELDMEQKSEWLTATPIPSIRSALPFVQEIGDFYAHARYYTKREGLASYLIKYTVSGEGVLEYDGQTFQVTPGEIFWIDCKKPQHYCTSPKTGQWHVLWVHFYGPTCKAYYDLFLSKNNGQNSIHMPPTNNISSCIRELIALYQPREGSILADIRASGLVSHIMSECCSAVLTGRAYLGQPDCVQAARTYLLNHFHERITLDDLSKRYSINKYYFQKLFKKYTGYTPNEYLILSRLNKAKELLRTTNLPIVTIAERVGVDNASHFTNQFKKHEGITPNIYRQRWYR